MRDDGPRETRTCLSVLDRSTGRLTEFYEPGEGIGPAAWSALEAALARELDQGDVGAVVCSGSLPTGAPRDGYARVARLARGRSVATVLDTYGPALVAALAERPSVVKVNAAEAAEATGLLPTESVQAAWTLLELGAARAVVTLGPDGAVACDGVSAWRLRSPEPPGAYPVGSGDAFVAGLAVALVEGASFVEAARRGVAAGTANALVGGAGVLDTTSAERILGTVESVLVREPRSGAF